MPDELDAKCYGEQTEQAVADAEAKAEKRGSKVVKKSPYQCGVYDSATKRPTKTNTVLYVYNDSMGKKTMEWAPPPPIAVEKKAKTKDEKQAEREAKKRMGLLQSAKDEAESKFNDWTEEHADDGSWPKWFVDCAVEDFVREICDYGSGDLESAVDAFARNTGFTASNAEADAVYKEYLAKEGGEA